MKKNLLIIFCLLFLTSCSPLYTLFIQNNSDNPIKVYVELKNEKYTENFKKVIEKRNLYNFKASSNINEFEIDSIRYYLQANKFSEKKYDFKSKLNYNFTLDPRLLTVIDPNNSISIYPFEKIYYIQDGKKCFIIPETVNQECNYKTTKKEKLKKDNSVKEYASFIEIGNQK